MPLTKSKVTKNFINDFEFALHIRMLPIFVHKEEQSYKIYETLSDSDYFSENKEFLMPIIDYFEVRVAGLAICIIELKEEIRPSA